MVRKFKLNENKYSEFNEDEYKELNYSKFDPKDFYKYIYNICENVVERFENNYPVQRIGAEFPTYNYNWAADFVDNKLSIARDEAIEALTNYQLLTHLYYYNGE